MNEKRKISGRKVLQVLTTLVLVAATVVAILSASGRQDAARIKNMNVHIRNSAHKFISEQDVKNMLLTGRHIELTQMPLSKLDVKAMERILQANPWVQEAQVYVDNNRTLQVHVTQRTPLARLFDQTGNSYYLDAALQAMPLSTGYVPYASVVTNVPLLRDDSASKALKGQIVALVQYIEKDNFWNAQISQIMLTDDRAFELVPVLGKQRIVFGDTAQMDRKFHNLFAFYTKVLNRVGWDKYDTLDLRFEGQVVAAPALQWKMPPDRAMSNMNWVKSIMDSTTMQDNDERSEVFATMNASLAAANKRQQRRLQQQQEQTQPAPSQPVATAATAPQSPNNAPATATAPQSPNRAPVTSVVATPPPAPVAKPKPTPPPTAKNTTPTTTKRKLPPPAATVVNAGKALPKKITRPQATQPTPNNRTTAPGATVINAGKALPKKITSPAPVSVGKIRNTPTPISAVTEAHTVIKPQAAPKKKTPPPPRKKKTNNNNNNTTTPKTTRPPATPQAPRKTTTPQPKPNNDQTSPKYIYQGN